MTLTEIIGAFKTKLNALNLLNSLEKAADFYDESDIDSEMDDSGETLKNNPYSSSCSASANNAFVNNASVKSLDAENVSENRKVPLIKLNDVWKIYPMGESDFAALRGINLEIYEGEFLVVLGPSGSGKSTIMNLIGCLDLPSKGTVFLNSCDISELEESELARIRGQMIGFIFQSFNLIPTLNTLENVLLPLEFQEEDPHTARKKAAYLLEIVGLSNKKHNLPSQLSGGQRQRVAIARSLAVNPPIILADEPTGNLDSKTGNYILEFLDGLNKKEGKTIIIVTHDLELVKYATRIVYIRDGQIEKIEECMRDKPEGII
ncbi:putative ABC transport system ATP-binding protein [Methanosarcina thermophila]|jgi:putative ABC transport system ATP-binding protein|uniref:ABC transporter ATP-binding protein n=3 Tax=Methanosarcina thermophila TaxID=2210 RepID=A0A1I6ZVG8_METTE|nr:ABC transporter ATP-binding protein [Methanosarcina thermophila]AKB12341.1 ABC transporter, ATP-binding protein [Methanosarcina thermophila TM-1]AKB14455.1 ABC transporter, ATP-binding protein [Methanosarcina thermophila CHTI-55]SFT66615.1 putative ABC transport system ATP-binding protein [Methanosarcina thermophila]BAW30037.1 ABC transporter ATP-binding protein [Methanosarcina thermophila]GLI13812.1 ABC transporter ATP-binding protein [Methanosarcina thermophila MST-A1]